MSYIYYPNVTNKKYIERRKVCHWKRIKNKEAIEYIKEKNIFKILSRTNILSKQG